MGYKQLKYHLDSAFNHVSVLEVRSGLLVSGLCIILHFLARLTITLIFHAQSRVVTSSLAAFIVYDMMVSSALVTVHCDGGAYY